MPVEALKRAIYAAQSCDVSGRSREQGQRRNELDAALTAVAALIDQANGVASDASRPLLRDLATELRRKRLFLDLFDLCTALADAGLTDARISLHHAQAAIEIKEFPLAMRELYKVIFSTADENVKGEARNLLGRLHKQQYVDEGNEWPDSRIDTAFVMGYPRGGNLSYTDRNNAIRRFTQGSGLAYGWLDEERKHHLYVHYYSSTEEGSSGSPVLDADLNGVYAMHHFGPEGHHREESIERAGRNHQIKMLNGYRDTGNRPVYWIANQGVLLRSIVEEARAYLSSSGDGREARPDAARTNKTTWRNRIANALGLPRSNAT